MKGEDKKSFIENHLGKLTIPEIATKLDISKSQLKRIMKKHDLKQNKEFTQMNRVKSASLGGKSLGGTMKVQIGEDVKAIKLSKVANDERLNEINRVRRTNRREYHRKKALKRSPLYREERLEKKRKCVEYKGGKCQKCGYDKCIAALDFHHRDPNEKEFVLSNNITDWDKIKKELDKCDLLCANCHREVHYLREQGIECDYGKENNKTENREGFDRQTPVGDAGT